MNNNKLLEEIVVLLNDPTTVPAKEIINHFSTRMGKEKVTFKKQRWDWGCMGYNEELDMTGIDLNEVLKLVKELMRLKESAPVSTLIRGSCRSLQEDGVWKREDD